MISPMKDYYRILDIPLNADQKEIEKAYKRLKELVLNRSISLYSLLPASEKDSFLEELEEAYSVLINPEKRYNYDINLKGINKIEGDREPGGLKQLSFGFAREPFTFLDYTRKTEKISDNLPLPVEREYLTRSEGLSIKLIEEAEDKSDHKVEDSVRESNIEEREPVHKAEPAISNNEIPDDLLRQPVAQEEKIQTIEQSASRPEDLQIDRDENRSEEKSETRREENIIIDENTEFSGELLRKVRESMGLTIKDIASITKISTANIKYIEEESYENLPALVYVKGFITQIAKCLNLRPDLVVRSYVARMTERMEAKKK